MRDIETGVLSEDNRPQKVADCILPPRLKKAFQKIVDSGELPNMLFHGGPGVGKTTVAKAICQELGIDWILINGSDEKGIDVLRTKVRDFASTMSVMAGAEAKKAVIFDESDYLNPNSTQPALRGMIEEFAGVCRFIFTCNYRSKIIEPLHSRLADYSFAFTKAEAAPLAAEFFMRCEEILKAKGVEYDRPVLAEFVKKLYPDFRKTLNELQKYAASGKIDAGILASMGSVKLQDLIDMMKTKRFKDLRQFLAENGDMIGPEFFDQLYRSLSDAVEGPSIPQAVLILGEYQFKAAFVANQEINAVAACVELMSQCQFK